MSDLSLFLPITKVDAALRLVYGVATAEQPDRSNEICDYASTKPHYEKWSTDIAAATQGKSFGNVRAMHGKVAAGKVTAIAFNDGQKQIEIAAKIVDDAEWAKVQEGVYTGFSQGGAYEKRWQDPEDTALTRYTARPSEVSLVDLPCLPGATFTMVKADGAEEQVQFVSVEKTLEEPKPEPDLEKKTETPVDADEWAQVWQSKRDGKTFKTKAELKKYHEQLDAAAVADKAAEPAMKALGELQAALEPKSDAPPAEPAEKREFSSSERKADAKSGVAEDDGSYPIPDRDALRRAIRAYGRSKNKAKTKAHIIARARALGATSMLPKGWSGSTKKMQWITGEIDKDISHCARLCDLIEAISYLQRSIEAEAKYESDGSAVPANIKSTLSSLCDDLKAMVDEEVDELMAYDGPEDLLKILIETDKDGAIAKLHGDDFAELGFPATAEKAGARNSRGDAERLNDIKDKANEIGKHADELQLARELTAAAGGGRAEHHIEQIKVKGARIRDHAMILLGTDGGKSEEPADLQKLQAENTALIAKMDAMAETMTAIAARLKKVEDEPMPLPGAGAVRSISKAEDNGGAPDAPVLDESAIAKMMETPEGQQQLFMMATKAALNKPMPISR